jgi:phosphoglycolate phosphatase
MPVARLAGPAVGKGAMEKMGEIPNVIFDLDGTLVDSVGDLHAAVARTLADEGADPLPIGQVRSFIGNGIPMLVERVMEARGESPDPERHADLLARFMAHYRVASTDLTTAFPGVGEALTELIAAGAHLGVCTNKPAGLSRDILAGLKLDHAFEVVIGGDSLPERKPHPEPLLAAVRTLGGKPAVYVGDSEVDAETSAAAELPFVLFTKGYRKTAVELLPCDAYFDDFTALPALLRDLPAR